jgi:hypothetical protein
MLGEIDLAWFRPVRSAAAWASSGHHQQTAVVGSRPAGEVFSGAVLELPGVARLRVHRHQVVLYRTDAVEVAA